MIEPIITYLNALLTPLGFRTFPLTGLVERGDATFPAVYLRGGEYQAINAEVSTVYHRLLDGPNDTDDEDDESPVNNSIVTRTYSLRAVAIFPHDLYGDDDQYLEDKVIRNLAGQLKHRNIKTLKNTLELVEVSTIPGASARGREAWDEEFDGIEYAEKRRIVYVDYTLTLRGFSNCLDEVGCGDADIDVRQAIIDEYCTDGDCDPASITTNGDSPALEVASGATQDIAIHDSAGADVGTRSGATVTIADGTVTVNGAGSIAAVAEGTTNVNVHDSAGADVGTLSGSTVTVGDSAITVNGDALTDLRAEQNLDVEVEYAGGGVVPTTISGGKVLVPDSAPSVGMFPLRSGQTVSSATGDDGDLQFGRDADWLTLDGTNPWGNNYRFTGFTGGYYDQSAMSWKDSSGATVTESVAIPEDIVIDWAHQKRDGSQVVGWGRVLQGPHTWVDFISNALAYSTTSFPTGWFPPGSKTFESICKHYVPTNFGFRLFYPPFNLSSIDVWSATEVGHASTQAIRFPASTTLPMFATAKTSAIRWLPCRIFNVSGTTLS